MHDKHGQCATFFRYKSNMVDFHTQMKKVTIGRINVDHSLEALRKMLVLVMREGEPMVINIDAQAPDFIGKFTGSAQLWPSQIVFNRD